MLEFLYRRENVELRILTSRITEALSRERRSSIVNNRKTQRQIESLTVRAEGKSYMEVLRSIKESVDVDKLGLKISSIRKVGENSLRLNIEGGGDKANSLKREIQNSVNNTKVRVRNNDQDFFILDIDGTTGEAEIVSMIQGELGLDPGSFTIKALNPNRAGNQTAIVAVREEHARKFQEAKRIRIGWVACRIKSKIQLIRCYRCLEFGHRTTECKGADRSKNCMNCCSAGHQARECQQEPYCLSCDITGHRMDQTKCQKYRRLLEESRRNTKDAPRNTNDR
ncbi:unnamed protein product [Ceutorhynchus assimilis]|uniref:CCHC-type domain-containing protein n=1 Tax=Ceutorhynchus assimilis TaxID=467358 RepID=A0A9N9MLX1_9CUCU|nr:unnamed protein product [Ceutorhynchus assimilis]